MKEFKVSFVIKDNLEYETITSIKRLIQWLYENKLDATQFITNIKIEKIRR